ncbi:MAG: CvpA family protein [Bacteroidetes Order II. Incertae sedis bacterium]|nr:CvpA family protein [Bacteroidetes Order II. bacterium]
MIHLNILDIAILLFCIYQGYKGYTKGAVKTIIPLVYWVVTFFGAIFLMRQLGEVVFVKLLGFSVMLASLLSFAIIIVIAVWGYRKVLDFLEDVVSGSISLVNQLVGMVVGALKGFFLASMILIISSSIDIPSKNTRDRSSLYADTTNFSKKMLKYVGMVWPQAEGITNKFEASINK